MDFEKIFKQCVIDNKNDICRIIDIDKDKKSIADFQFKKFPDSFKIEDYTFLKPDKVDSLPDEEGVYVFVAKKEIEFNLAEVFYKFILLDSSLSEHFVCTPSLN